MGAAMALVRLMASLLFGVNPFDPITYAAVVGALGVVALVATWLPARHATKIDPMLALRSE
jgi:ABC-type antimicrobial peptide transport system permease subunit